MKQIKRILLGLLIVIGVLILFLPLSIIADGVIARDRLTDITNTSISGADGGPNVHAYIAKPIGEGPFPTVIMIHEFFGLNDSMIGRADLLAEQGYYVIAPDTFRGSTTSWIPRAIYQVMTAKPDEINVDLDSVYAWLETQPDVDADRIAILGFCYGGRTSLAYSLHNNKLAATVIFYGSPETDSKVLKNLPGPVLGIFGAADRSIPVEDVNAFDHALTEAGVPHQVSIYDGQPHAFIQGAEGIKSGGAQGEAWNEMLEFLEKNLKNSPISRNGQTIAYSNPFDWRYYAMLAFEHALGPASHMH
jgi:carboxymethylenebutenolidase